MALLFIASAIFVLYVLFGYPALVLLLSRKMDRPFQMRFTPRTVTILLPVRNGEAWIGAKLRSIAKLDYPRNLVQVIVISDGSDDGTEEIVREHQADGVELLRVPRGGKAAALNAGMKRSRGEILFFTDVRQELAADSLKRLVSCFADPRVGVASGELVIMDGRNNEQANVGLYWKYEKWIRMKQSRIDSVMGATGCIYAMRRELALPLPPHTLLDDVWLPLAAFFRGYRIVLVGAKAFDRPAALQTEFRRKVRTLAGVYQVIGSYPALLGPANRMWLHFVSHKLGRLLLPFALLALALSSFRLPPFWAAAAITGQATFYALAALDLVLPEKWALKRLSSPVRTFVVLMAASACAVSIFFIPGQALWKTVALPAANDDAA